MIMINIDHLKNPPAIDKRKSYKVPTYQNDEFSIIPALQPIFKDQNKSIFQKRKKTL